MKFPLFVLSLPLFALAAPTPAPAPLSGHGDAPGFSETGGISTLSEVPGSGGSYNVIVDNDDPRSLDVLLAEMNLTREDARYIFENSAFKGFSANLSEHCVGALSTMTGLKLFEPDMEIEKSDSLPGTWGLKRMSQAGPVIAGRNNLTAFNFSSYVFEGSAAELGKGVDIYMLDTGVHVDHVDFDGRATFGFSVDNSFTDDDGHGTHTAGTAASTTFGVAKAANIIAVKVISQDSGASSNVIKGIDWMIRRHDARKLSNETSFRGSVASMSLGSKTRSSVIEEAIVQASAAGIHFSVAAGNENQDACRSSPSAASKGTDIVSVGAINVRDSRSSFSNFGSCVTIYAPGESIISTWNGGSNFINTISGTSMACPHISGLMAVLLSQDPSLSTTKMKEKIISMALDIKLDKDRSTGDPGIVVNNGIMKQNP